ncbi:GMC family oxidoreductase [Ancylobacter defluvii]|uniref:2-keto-gluconate dehydrogenase n=1 Tax=Ancylobacter defluvii TaxID=1282440 RepID=A0A9W6JYY1_9HYPH|nr:GMC family oxidoreductase [Ancylobacter defluvii]MBS7588083.1 GMC family oxidoreductase [Ancylobacter defluvii]GLK86475.1 2-keto-gluconate dehydrogenase [Ancylobacter defluvii]
MTKYDLDDSGVVVIVGSGAGGGTLAHELVKRGVEVVLLEAGKHLTADDFVNDEWAGYEMLSWLDKRTASGTWRAAKDHPTAPSWSCQVVGGTTTHWSACCYRFIEDEFRAKTLYGEIPGTSLIDWPFTVADIAPYYELAEAKMGVTRTNGLPGLPANNNFKVMYAGGSKLGYNVSTGRHAINSIPYDGRPATIQDGFTITGDKTGARWSTLAVEIPRALATGKLELRPQSRVTFIEHDAAGKASAVVYVDAAGVTHRQKARAVVLAGNCIETSRLLLHSKSGRFTDGLANGYGHVGRHYLRHIIQTVWSIFDKPVYMHRGEIMGGMIDDFVRHDPARGFAGGYYIEMNSMGLPTTAAFLDPGWWGRDFVSVIEQYRNMAGIFMSGEDMPQPGNRVTLGDELDAFGVPVANLHYDDHPNDLKLRVHGYKTLSAIHAAAGAKRSIEAPSYPASHNLGSNRMAAKAEDGVLDGNGRAWEVPNLFIADGSTFSTGGACNPTLTIVALAIRQAEFMAGRMAAGEL